MNPQSETSGAGHGKAEPVVPQSPEPAIETPPADPDGPQVDPPQVEPDEGDANDDPDGA